MLHHLLRIRSYDALLGNPALDVSPAGDLYCIEIKFSSAPVIRKGFYQSIEDLNPSHKFVVVPAGDSYPKEGGIRVINLNDFLKTL
jgi:predicted AAA+ superfamily ATPase